MEWLVIGGLIALYVGALAWANWAATYEQEISTFLSRAEAKEVAQRSFNGLANNIQTTGSGIAVTPRAKRKAPTLHIDFREDGGGTVVTTGADFTVLKRGMLPGVPMHAGWIWRKQRKIAKRLGA